MYLESLIDWLRPAAKNHTRSFHTGPPSVAS